MIYQWLHLEVSIFYALKELLCMFSICISSSNISDNNNLNFLDIIIYV